MQGWLRPTAKAVRVVGGCGDRVMISAGHVEFVASKEPVTKYKDWGTTIEGKLLMKREKRWTLWRVKADIVRSGSITTWAAADTYFLAYECVLNGLRNDPDVRVRLMTKRCAEIFCKAVGVAWVETTKPASNYPTFDARVVELVELMKQDRELQAQGLTTKHPKRVEGYRRLHAAKSDQPEKYSKASAIFDSEKRKN